MSKSFYVVSSEESVEQKRLVEDLRTLYSRDNFIDLVIPKEVLKEYQVAQPKNVIEEKVYLDTLRDLLIGADRLLIDLRNLSTENAFEIGTFLAYNGGYYSSDKMIVLDGKKKDIQNLSSWCTSLHKAMNEDASPEDNKVVYYVVDKDSAIEAAKHSGNGNAYFAICLDEDDFDTNLILGFFSSLLLTDRVIAYTSKRQKKTNPIKKHLYSYLYDHKPDLEELEQGIPVLGTDNKKWELPE